MFRDSKRFTGLADCQARDLTKLDFHFNVSQWTGLETLVIEQSSRILWNKTTYSTRFFLSSLASDFANFPGSIRSHWGIENQLHWCLDVIFSEDNSRIRKDYAPRNMTILTHIGS